MPAQTCALTSGVAICVQRQLRGGDALTAQPCGWRCRSEQPCEQMKTSMCWNQSLATRLHQTYAQHLCAMVDSLDPL
jgi:hypothetical protein